MNRRPQWAEGTGRVSRPLGLMAASSYGGKLGPIPRAHSELVHNGENFLHAPRNPGHGPAAHSGPEDRYQRAGGDLGRKGGD